MGNIEFVGIINDFFNEETETKESIGIPENAHFIKDENWIDMLNPLNWFIIGMPIFAIILFIMAFKQRKNGIFNKEVKKDYNEKNKITDKRKILTTILKRFFSVIIIFMLGMLIVIPIHELLHCIAGAVVGLDMKFGIDFKNFMAFAYTENPLTKVQYLVMLLTPLIILAIIPLIILFVTYPKKEKSFKKGLIYWIFTCFIGCVIMCSCPDIIQSFNVIKNMPINAVMENDYWYIPNDLIQKETTNNILEENVKRTETLDTENNNKNIKGDIQNNKVEEIKIKVSNEILTMKLEQNEATKILVEKLKQDDITVNTSEYGGFEQTGDLGFSLPRDDIQIKTKVGDVMLYQGNQISIFYASNSWSYTKLGEIINKTENELKNIFNSINKTIILSID